MINKPNNSFYHSGKQLTQVNALLTNAIWDGEAKAAGDILLLTDGLSIDSRVHRVMAQIGTLTGSADNNLVLVKEVKQLDGSVDYEVVLNLVEGLDLGTASTAIDDLLRTTSLDKTLSIRELLEAATIELPSRVFLALECEVIAGATVNADIDVVIEEATSY